MVQLYPATTRQAWHFGARLDGKSTLSVAVVLLFRHCCDRDALQVAINALVARHAALRTTLVVTSTGVAQSVADAFDVEIEYVQHNSAAATSRTLLDGAIRQAMDDPFAVQGGALLRARLLNLGQADAVVLVVHHSVCDGWSASLLARDLADLYRAAVTGEPAALPRLDFQFPHYAAWEHQRSRAAPPRYWSDHLTPECGSALLANMSAGRGRAAVFVMRALPSVAPEAVNALQQLAISQRTTLARALIAGVVGYINAIATRITVGVWLANRNRPELHDVVGELADLLPLSLDMHDDPPFADFVGRVHRVVSDSVGHWAPFATLSPMMEGAIEPVLDFTINYQQFAHLGRSTTTPLPIEIISPNLEGRRFRLDWWRQGFGLVDYQYRHLPDGSLGGYLLYNSTAIPDHLASDFAVQATDFLTRASIDPNQRLSDLTDAWS